MKRILLIGFWACLVGSVRAEDPSYLETVSRKWLNGQWNEVRDIGYARIAADTNDIAGYIFLLSYDVRQANITNILDRLARIQTLGESFTGEYFRVEFPSVAFTRDLFKAFAAAGPIELDAAERQKASITNKTLVFDHILEALEKDGYFAAGAEVEAQHLKNIRAMLSSYATILMSPDHSDPRYISDYAEKNNIPTEKVSRIALEIATKLKDELESRGGNTLWYDRAMGLLIWKPDPIYLPFLEEASLSTNSFVRGKALLGYIALKKADSVEFAEARLATGLYSAYDQRDIYWYMGKQIQLCDEEEKKKIIGFLLRQSMVVNHFYPRDVLEQILLENLPGYRVSVQREQFARRLLESTDNIVCTSSIRIIEELRNVPSGKRTDLSDWMAGGTSNRVYAGSSNAVSTNVLQRLIKHMDPGVEKFYFENELRSYPVEMAIPALEKIFDESTNKLHKARAFSYLSETERKTRNFKNSLRIARKTLPSISGYNADSFLNFTLVQFLAEYGDASDLPLFYANTNGAGRFVREFAERGIDRKRPRRYNKEESVGVSHPAPPNKNISLRFREVSELSDQAALAKIAIEEKDMFVRSVAVSKLTDQALLLNLARNETNGYVRRTAISKLADQKVLSRIATEDKDEYNRKVAVEYLADQKLLAKFALEDGAPIVRRAAIERVSDRAVLAKIAAEDEDEYNRKAAAKRLTQLK